MSNSTEFDTARALAYTLDTSRPPLVIVRATPAANDEAAVAAWYAAVDALLARDLPFVSLSDMRGAPSDARRRKRFMAFVQPRKELLQRLCRAHGILAGSTLEKGFVTAYLWLVGDEVYVPMRVFEAESEATAWLIEQYQRRSS